MTEDCILCSIIEGKIPSKKVYEDDDSLAILDVNGSNPGHCFVIPKQHYPILEQAIKGYMGKKVQIVDPAVGLASSLLEFLKKKIRFYPTEIK